MSTNFPVGRQGSEAKFPITDYRGLLVIGDPHLEGRSPGFRKDDYPQTILQKLHWCLATARQEKLLPVLLGDLFQVPRDNPNWLINELIQMLDQKTFAIYGNHDVHGNQLGLDDTFSILESAGCIELLNDNNCFQAQMNGHNVLVGGTSWGQPIPDAEQLDLSGEPVVIWLTHHDLMVPGYESGRIELDDNLPFDLVINGHIHRRLEEYRIGETVVVTPGSITRRKRSDATRNHVPSVLLVEFAQHGWGYKYIEVPHRPFEEVFHASVVSTEIPDQRSDFVSGLAELQSRRTESGEGLSEFLAANLGQFEPDIAQEIQSLADEVLERS